MTDVRIIVQHPESGQELVIDSDDLESFGLSLPSDVYVYEDNHRELGRTHIALTGIFKEGVRPEWKEIDNG